MRHEILVGNATALNEKQVARLLNISVALLRKWRRGKDGPRWLKLGRVVRYLATDIDAWLETRAIVSGSAAGRGR